MRPAREIIKDLMDAVQEDHEVLAARDAAEARVRERERAEAELAKAQEKARRNTRAGFIEL